MKEKKGNTNMHQISFVKLASPLKIPCFAFTFLQLCVCVWIVTLKVVINRPPQACGLDYCRRTASQNHTFNTEWVIALLESIASFRLYIWILLCESLIPTQIQGSKCWQLLALSSRWRNNELLTIAPKTPVGALHSLPPVMTSDWADLRSRMKIWFCWKRTDS